MLLIGVRFVPLLRNRHKTYLSPTPCGLWMFRFMIRFPLCFTRGKAHGRGTSPKCGARLGNHLILDPLCWECPSPLGICLFLGFKNWYPLESLSITTFIDPSWPDKENDTNGNKVYTSSLRKSMQRDFCGHSKAVGDNWGFQHIASWHHGQCHYGRKGEKKGELVIQCQNHWASISPDFWKKKKRESQGN